jgi:hypothetical protein
MHREADQAIHNVQAGVPASVESDDLRIDDIERNFAGAFQPSHNFEALLALDCSKAGSFGSRRDEDMESTGDEIETRNMVK